jgi:hypothetical protein
MVAAAVAPATAPLLVALWMLVVGFLTERSPFLPNWYDVPIVVIWVGLPLVYVPMWSVGVPVLLVLRWRDRLSFLTATATMTMLGVVIAVVLTALLPGPPGTDVAYLLAATIGAALGFAVGLVYCRIAGLYFSPVDLR